MSTPITGEFPWAARTALAPGDAYQAIVGAQETSSTPASGSTSAQLAMERDASHKPAVGTGRRGCAIADIDRPADRSGGQLNRREPSPQKAARAGQMDRHFPCRALVEPGPDDRQRSLRRDHRRCVDDRPGGNGPPGGTGRPVPDPMSARLRLNRCQSGVAAVEMALVAPLLLALLFGSVELGKYFLDQHVVVKAVRDGAVSRPQPMSNYRRGGGVRRHRRPADRRETGIHPHGNAAEPCPAGYWT